MALAERMGGGLAHLHLADGHGASTDEHLLPGDGGQPCEQVCRLLAESDFTGHVVLEVSTQGARTRSARAGALTRSLAFAREHLHRAPRLAITTGPEHPRATTIEQVHPSGQSTESGAENHDS